MDGLPRVPIWVMIKCLASARARSAARALSGYRRPRFTIGDETPIQTFYDGPLFDPLRMRAGLTPLAGIPPYGLPAPSEDLSWLATLHKIDFQVDPARSFFGDCINIVDAPNERPLDSALPPFGWSKPSLTEGMAVTCSTLTGKVEVSLSTEADGFMGLCISHGGGLRGVDGILSTPSGYGITVQDNLVRDSQVQSHAKLELATGRLHDFHYNVEFANSAIRLLCALNPGLTPPPLLFPGLPHAGHTMGWLETTADGSQLVLHIIAQQFLPLGPSVGGQPLQMPPSQTPYGQSSPFSAANSSLHPYISLVAVAAAPAKIQTNAKNKLAHPCQKYRRAEAFPKLQTAGSLADYQNKVLALRCIPGATDFGDNFALRSSELGGAALARSPLFGDLQIQFGTIVEGKLPFVLRLASPTQRLSSKAKKLLSLLPPGTQPGLVGMHGKLCFPAKVFQQHELSLTSDPYKISVGIVDISRGVFDDMVLRAYLFQNVMRNLLLVEPRTPTDSFCYICDGKMRSTAAGLVFHLYGEFTIPYPSGYAFPLPGGRKTRIETGSHLLPFLNIAAVSTGRFQPYEADFQFRSTRHVRGRLDATTTLVVHSVNGHQIADLVTESGRTEAIVERVAIAEIGDLEVIEIEMMTANGRSKVGEAIYGVAVVNSHSAELLLVSEQENFDSWVEGRLIRTSSHRLDTSQL